MHTKRRRDDKPEEYTRKIGRLDHDVVRLHSDIRRLTAEVASLVRETRTLRGELPEPRNSFLIPERQREISDDTDVDSYVLGHSDAHGNSQHVSVSQHERLVEQQLAEQLQIEQQQAEHRLTQQLELHLAEKY